ncbi:hypothetical protein [Acutalibacter muris]|jgi:hypothetical protein|uniref:hypothetical protein n=1 Tax=Acutalibacter muris TaxID=1796620 RepID=UPI0026F3EE4B|nr:hypothetical protein [Acutalibacter muris]
MQKENFRNVEYPRFRVHWSVKLLGLAWAVALVFIIGMVAGGILGAVEGDGANAAVCVARSPTTLMPGTALISELILY